MYIQNRSTIHRIVSPPPISAKAAGCPLLLKKSVNATLFIRSIVSMPIAVEHALCEQSFLRLIRPYLPYGRQFLLSALR